MKGNVIILHGTGEGPQYMWLPWIKKKLEEQGFKVFLPLLPNTDDPKLEEQTNYCLENLDINEETILIGHSSGCPLMLSILEQTPKVIKKAILVAGYTKPLKIDPANTKSIKEDFKWETIKKHCNEFVILNSDNDPWGADDNQGRYIQEKIGGKFILMKGQGHMGSLSFNEPYMEFPFLLQLIDGTKEEK